MKQAILPVLLGAAVLATACGEHPDTPLTQAAAAGDVPAIRRLIQAGANVNAFDGDAFTPLIVAARRGRVQALHVLLEAGAQVDRRDGRGNRWTPLVHAIHKGRTAAARVLLEAGAEVDAAQGGGATPLMFAAAYGNTEIVRELLARGANPRARASGGVTALGNAVGGGALFDITDGPSLGTCHFEVAKALLQAAPDLTVPHGLPWRTARLFGRSESCRKTYALLDAAPRLSRR